MVEVNVSVYGMVEALLMFLIGGSYKIRAVVTQLETHTHTHTH